MKSLCACEGPRFEVTITAMDEEAGQREAGPTMRCCGVHLLAARVIANDLDQRDPTLAIAFDVCPVEEPN